MTPNPEPRKAVDGRHCGGCTLCCKVMAITSLEKPPGVWCKHCHVGVGCRIYDDRPDECRTFLCAWLVDAQLGPEWKPDKSRMVITPAANGNGLDIRCDPGFPAAWRKEPYHSRIVGWARDAAPFDGTIIICVADKSTLVTPDGEFSFRNVKSDEVVAREMSGNKVVGVRIVKASELKN
jgi:hypothetical protein